MKKKKLYSLWNIAIWQVSRKNGGKQHNSKNGSRAWENPLLKGEGDLIYITIPVI